MLSDTNHGLSSYHPVVYLMAEPFDLLCYYRSGGDNVMAEPEFRGLWETEQGKVFNIYHGWDIIGHHFSLIMKEITNTAKWRM